MTKTTAMIGLGLLVSAAAVTVVALRFAGLAEAASPPPTSPSPRGPAAPAPSNANATPVLVELFTSEGCSSCPSADAVVAELARKQPVSGARVIVLAHHVDYWNAIGWPDPFSSNAATDRQRAYASLGGGSYTPQAVIDGRAEMVGSRRGAVEDAVLASSKRGHVKIDLEARGRADQPGVFDVTANVGALPDGATNDTDLLVAVVQDHARVKVLRGENAGRTLDHAGIARSLSTIANVSKSGGSSRTTVRVPAIMSAPDGTSFSVVTFVQERASRHVLGSATTTLSP